MTPRDLALPAALGAAVAIERAAGEHRPAATVAYAALMALLIVPLLWARRAPLVAALGCVAGMEAWTAAVGEGDGPMALLLIFMIGCYAGGAHADARRARVAGVVIVLAALTVPLVSLLSPDPLAADNIPFALVLGGVPWAGGRLNRTRRDRTERLRALAADLERAREEHERAAVLAERARIAAELNDAVAHGVAEVLMQAGAAAGVLDADPDAAARALRAVQDRGRATLDELRRMLVVLRAV